MQLSRSAKVELNVTGDCRRRRSPAPAAQPQREHKPVIKTFLQQERQVGRELAVKTFLKQEWQAYVNIAKGMVPV